MRQEFLCDPVSWWIVYLFAIFSSHVPIRKKKTHTTCLTPSHTCKERRRRAVVVWKKSSAMIQAPIAAPKSRRGATQQRSIHTKRPLTSPNGARARSHPCRSTLGELVQKSPVRNESPGVLKSSFGLSCQG